MTGGRMWYLCGVLIMSALTASALEIEAETGKSETGKTQLKTMPKASGTKAVSLQGVTSPANKPTVKSPADWVIVFESAKAGGYDLELQYFADSNGDSFFAAVDDGEIREFHTKTGDDPLRLPLGASRLEAGAHQLKLWTRERGFTADKLILTPAAAPAGRPVRLQAEDAVLNPKRVETVGHDQFTGKKGIMLKPGVKAVAGSPTGEPDVTFKVNMPEGRYWVRTVSSATPALYQEIRNKAKQASPRVDVALGDQFKNQLVIYSPWQNPKLAENKLAKFNFSGAPQELKLWLPEGVLLDDIQIVPYTPPKIPAEVAAYKPKLVPPKDRPRILVTSQLLPKIKANLNSEENRPVWEMIKNRAARQVSFKAPAVGYAPYDAKIEVAMADKAFVYLMTGDKKMGHEAVKLAREYLKAVDFGNMLDITREIGRAIYSAALVYDWCYDLMTPEDKASLRADMMRLADDMEIGWPPFLQQVVNGHGNEHQISRDLFSMAVALYDEDPEPYKICAYRMLEELSPMHTVEYAGGRHNQGMSYGMSRFSCDMIAAWNIKRTLGIDLFGDTIKRVPYAWIYMRLPNGELMRDGDDFINYQQRDKYWSNVDTAFLCYTYADDPVLKGDYLRQAKQWGAANPMLFLLLNNPDTKPQPDRSSLPLTLYMGGAYPAMVARTGFDFGDQANDAIFYLTGAEYQSANHQHLNAGDFQIYYRGMLAADLGTYRFYGTPYDANFNKKSVSHNVMLARDPANSNDDGGQIYLGSSPNNLKELENTRNGRMLAAAFGPSKQRPFYSYFKVDLAPAYPKGKMAEYVRSFYVLNQNNPERPAALLVFDHMKTNDAKLKKYWPLNTFGKPEVVSPGKVTAKTLNGEGKITLDTLFPAAAALEVTTASGEESHKVFGKQYEAPFKGKESLPEVEGSRTVLSPKKTEAEATFVNLLQVTAGKVEALPAKLAEDATSFTVNFADKSVNLSRDGKARSAAVTVPVAGRNPVQVLISDLAPGTWTVKLGTSVIGVGEVDAKAGTLFFTGAPGTYTVTPGATAQAKPLPDYSQLMPDPVKPTQIDFNAKK